MRIVYKRSLTFIGILIVLIALIGVGYLFYDQVIHPETLVVVSDELSINYLDGNTIISNGEYRFSVTIDVHDFDTRVRNARKYLEKGHRVKASVKFKGRELAYPEHGRDVLVRYANALEDVATIEQAPQMEGRFMNMILMPKKEK